MTSLAIMGLLPSRGVTVGGSVRLEGQELIGAADKKLRCCAGRTWRWCSRTRSPR
ncbi:hypothetical protein [Blastococcus brunescens]|uniref:Uncharacterized protein n=1 Tax=Blastococcus brunescens TaxID=1564165 RepID=A0ABZ1B115_9ACTN|nr:hypothetical protein [Blastococcus sp. BMG 8361]WRL64424.1 hypothetical protein U6N30_00780 [Blastococcus sp. BMG 8361]